MLLSVVIPVWNRAEVIVRCINSVLAQELDELELIVVDNGSTDATAATIAAISDRRVRLLSLEKNMGASAARNAGLAAATGTYVAFVDSDDAFGPQWSQVVTQALATDAAVVTCGFAMLDQQGRWRYDQACQDMGPAFFHLVGPFQAGTFAAKTAVMRTCGGYTTDLWYSENTELALRLSKHCHDQSLVTSHLDQPLLQWFHNPEHVYVSQTRMRATTYLLAVHHDQLARDRPQLVSYHSQLGVWNARCDDLQGARQQFWSALKADWRSWRNIGRFAIATNRCTAARVWPSEPRQSGKITRSSSAAR